MAGFGAGFGKAFGGSLEAAGKLHQQEQMRSREYERAKADRQAERLEDRAWEVGDKEKEKEDRAAEQPHRYSKGPDGKFYYTRFDGTKVEKDANDPGVRLYLQDEEKRGQERTMFGLDVEGKRVGIQRDKAAIRASDASVEASRSKAKADAGKLPDDVYAKVQFDLKPVTTTYDNIDKKTQALIAKLQNDNTNPNITAAQKKANNALIAEAREMRRGLLPSQQALSAQYVASGFQADPQKLFEPRAGELQTKYPNAWGEFVKINKQDWVDMKAASAKKQRELKQ